MFKYYYDGNVYNLKDKNLRIRLFLSLRRLVSHNKHTFHIVTPSPWPFLSSIGAFMLTCGLTMYMHLYQGGLVLFFSGFFFILAMMFVWWRDVIREATFMGYHTKAVQRNMRLGMVLFIVSEVMFFFSFFWAFFHVSLSPSHVLGSCWPPIGINVINPYKIPLLNTIILLTSGLTVTVAHHAMRVNNILVTFCGLLLTIILGLEFTFWQAFEYYTALFYIFDGVYGSTFYMTTGLHGLHVLIGTIFLIVCFIRFIKGHFTAHHHIGLEAAIWYWHFVDVVWLFLYISIYCWGSGCLI